MASWLANVLKLIPSDSATVTNDANKGAPTTAPLGGGDFWDYIVSISGDVATVFGTDATPTPAPVATAKRASMFGGLSTPATVALVAVVGLGLWFVLKRR